MKGIANAGKSKKSILTHCQTLKLTAQSDADAEMLATIYRTLFGVGSDDEPRIVILDPKRPGEIGEWTR